MTSFSEYNLNYLLSFLLENRDVIHGDDINILCLSESNIHKEIRSRIQILLEAKKSLSTRIILIIHDCLIPILHSFQCCDSILNLDIPLSERILVNRQALLDQLNPRCVYLISRLQEDALTTLFAKHNSILEKWSNNVDLTRERTVSDRFARKRRELRDGVVDGEDIDINALSEKEKHALFYQNEESEIVDPPQENFVELNMNDLDVTELDNLEEDLKNSRRKNVMVPMTPLNPLYSIFNPFCTNGIYQWYSPFFYFFLLNHAFAN